MNKKYITLKIIGYENYPIKYLKYILLNSFKDDRDLNLFLLSINEAVCNAARYTTTNIKTCKINIQIYIDNKLIKVKISSDTHPTSAKDLKRELSKLKNEVSWSKCLKYELRGKGFWIMLEGTDNIYVDETMQSILLIKILNKQYYRYNNLSELLSKFHIGIPN